MKFELIAVGKLRNSHYRALTDDYVERLSHYLQVEEIEVAPSDKRTHDVDAGLEEEAEALRDASAEGAYEIALDEGGKEITSRQLAKWVDDWMIGGVRHVSFYIGSADGLDRSVRKASRRVWSLSKLTFPHEMARMILAEQLYRAMSIIRGEPYHR